VLLGVHLLADVFHWEPGDVRSVVGPVTRVLGEREQWTKLLTRQRNSTFDPATTPLTLEATTSLGDYGFTLQGGTLVWDAPMGDRLTLPGEGNTIQAQLALAKRAEPLVHLHPMQLEPRRLAESSVAESTEPTLGPDGSGLPTLFAHLAANDPERRDAIVDHLKRIVPGVRNVRVPKREIERIRVELVTDEDGVTSPRKVRTRRIEDVLELDLHEAGYLAADDVSSGTLTVLAILTLLHSPRCPKLLLLDEFERSLHPAALERFLEGLKTILNERPELQILATTHSPYAIDQVDAGDVVVLALDDQGHTQAQRLSEHTEFPSVRALSPGEFWSSVGEDWVNGARDVSP
jgi:hypothetical protein